jgi:NAD(P)-dependent dehydrogenase (short-subunit alcohol dehydrogenase family)
MKQIALVTGVSREMGLGFETAKQLASLGYKVIITARDLDRVQQLADKLIAENLDVTAKQLDINDDDSIKQLADQLVNEFGYLANHIQEEK